MIITVAPELMAKIKELEDYENKEAGRTLLFTWAFYEGGTCATGTASGNYPYGEYDINLEDDGTFTIYKSELDKYSYSMLESHPLSADYEEEEEEEEEEE